MLNCKGLRESKKRFIMKKVINQGVLTQTRVAYRQGLNKPLKCE
jgi:hypothetical protein